MSAPLVDLEPGEDVEMHDAERDKTRRKGRGFNTKRSDMHSAKNYETIPATGHGRAQGSIEGTWI